MIVKAKIDSVNPAIWYIFNLVFIAATQLSLLLLISTPAYIQLVVTNMGMEISKVDTIFPRILLALVLIEGLADHQQWGLYFQFGHLLVLLLIYMCIYRVPKREGEIQGHCQSPSRL